MLEPGARFPNFQVKKRLTIIRTKNCQFSMRNNFIKASKSYDNLTNLASEVLWISTQASYYVIIMLNFPVRRRKSWQCLYHWFWCSESGRNREEEEDDELPWTETSNVLHQNSVEIVCRFARHFFAMAFFSRQITVYTGFPRYLRSIIMNESMKSPVLTRKMSFLTNVANVNNRIRR